MTTAQILAEGRAADAPFEVIVGNIGSVFVGTERMAVLTFNTYVDRSQSLRGRAGGEDVTIFRNGEIVRYFEGRNNEEPDYDDVRPHNYRHLASGAPLRTRSID